MAQSGLAYSTSSESSAHEEPGDGWSAQQHPRGSALAARDGSGNAAALGKTQPKLW